VSFLVDDGQQTPQRHATVDTAVGVDRGVTVAAVNSGDKVHDRQFITAGQTVRYRRGRQPDAVVIAVGQEVQAPVREAGTRKPGNRPKPLANGIPAIHGGEDVNRTQLRHTHQITFPAEECRTQ
jgi:hypothetical protein